MFPLTLFAGSSRIEREGNYWGINSGPIVDNDVYILKRNAEKQITNLTVTSGNTASFQSFISLTTKNVAIDSNASVNFLARNEINILNDFEAHRGSEVLIHLDYIFPDCNEYTSYARLSNNTNVVVNISKHSTSKEIVLNFINKGFYSISPNPNNGIFEIIFEIVPNDVNNINVFNVFGELVYSVDTYDKILRLNLSYFSKGVYFIAVDFERKGQLKK